MKTRIYDDIIDIDTNSVKLFWNKRALKKSLKSVLLGEKLSENSAYLRNEKELNLLIEYFENNNYSLLDLGCGCARWANNLKTHIKSYTGVDFSEEFITKNKQVYNNFRNFEFINSSVIEMPEKVLSQTYDFIITTGVLMYLNDADLNKFFTTIKILKPKYFYLQESISTMDVRLTLSDFYSEELKENYNAIYRIKNEYEHYILSFLDNYNIIKQGLLLDESTGSREETNAGYWFCERKD